MQPGVEGRRCGGEAVAGLRRSRPASSASSDCCSRRTGRPCASVPQTQFASDDQAAQAGAASLTHSATPRSAVSGFRVTEQVVVHSSEAAALTNTAGGVAGSSVERPVWTIWFADGQARAAVRPDVRKTRCCARPSIRLRSTGDWADGLSLSTIR